MRHKKMRRRLGRPFSHRKACLRNMVRALFTHQKIKTTLTKAKEAGRLADELITLGKRGDLHAQRMAASVLGSRRTTTSLFKEIAPRFGGRRGGYTRIIRISSRKGDNAPMALLELTEAPLLKEKPKPKPTKTKPKAKPVEEKPPIEEKPSIEAKPPLEGEKLPKAPEKPSRLQEEPPKISTKPPRLKEKKPKKFLGDLRKFFKKERDSL